jgi:hypothetical protein
MGDYCRECRAGLEHCHGTIIYHPLRSPECTEDGCAGAEVIPHAFAVDCDVVGCGCTEPEALAVRPAAGLGTVQPIGSAMNRTASATGVVFGSG